METRIARLNKIAPRPIRAQAAVWVTDLHGPDRDARLEAKVRRWIEADPRHAAAFELATEAWQRSGNLPGRLPSRASHPTRVKVRATVLACIAVAVALAGVTGVIYRARDGVLVTGEGERKTIELTDGTQVSLNANSRVLVAYDDEVRRVTLTRGEALFNVVKHQPRPFVVIIGERKVIAMGTSFMVRREEAVGSAFAVTLVEGRIAVEPISGPDTLPTNFVSGLTLLNPGERLRIASDSTEAVDSPAIDKITAWQRGQLIFDDTSLTEAAAEFNRYGSHKIIIDSARAAGLRVGGVFRIGDPSSFAHAMASTYHLRFVERGDRIILDDAPTPPLE